MEVSALILSGGQVDEDQLEQEIQKLRQRAGLLIVADSGMEAVRHLLLKDDGQKDLYLPDYIVGDFDSVSEETLSYFRRCSAVRFEQHRPEKDESDTELALTIAAEQGVTSVLFMGVTGTRLDHMLSNLQLLVTAADQGIQARILDHHNQIQLIGKKDGRAGKTVLTVPKDPAYPFLSLIPVSEEVTHLTLSGFKYPLTDHHMVLGQQSGLCISNEITAKESEIAFAEGMLYMIRSRDV